MANPSDLAARGRFLDRVEQVIVVGLYCWFVVRLWPTEISAANWIRLLLLLSEGLVILLLLIRKPAVLISTDAFDWFVAAAGTFLVLLVTRGGRPFEPLAGGLLMLAGFITHFGAKISLWRSFGLVAANRGLKGRGLYAFVRHPMYAGYMLVHAGYLLAVPSWWNLVIYLSVWSLLVARILAEENVLIQDPAYRAYMARVRFRLVPGLF